MRKKIKNHFSIQLKKQADERDKQIFSWILSVYKKTGQFPTLNEIGNNYSFSKERARQLVERLISKGYLIRNAKQGWRKTYIINPKYLLK